VDGVLFDGTGELLANGAFSGVGWVGGAHERTQVGDGVFLFQNEENDGAGGHEGGEGIKEGASRVDGVEALSLGLGDGELLDGYDLEAGLLNLSQDGGGVALANCVWLDDAESALRHGDCSLDKIAFLLHCNGVNV